MGLASYLEQADAISRVLAVLLLLMSVASWALIVHKWRLLRRVRQDVPRAVAALVAHLRLALAVGFAP